MNRLQSELHRLYLAPAPAGRTRSAAMELARPADWQAMGSLWRGLQADLGLPAAAIAVSGLDGFQLWFSWAEPVALSQATQFIEALRARYLSDIPKERVSMPSLLPPLETRAGHWSAFVAPDLAPVFAEEPWLDTPPGDEGQADLLSRIVGIKDAEFRLAMERLGAKPQQQAAAAPMAPMGHAADEPRRFLRKVMNDEAVELALRIEAAKALLSVVPRRP